MESAGFSPIAMLIIIFNSLLLILMVEARGHDQQKTGVPGLFSFGDSLADVGTNEYVPNCTARVDFRPYGESFFHKPTGRFCNGRLLFDFLALRLGLPLQHPYLRPNSSFKHGASFASGGSGFLDSTNAALNVVPFSTQIQQFQELAAILPERLGHSRAHKLLSRAIYTIVSGGNEIFSSSSTTDPQAFVDLLLQKARTGLLALYQAGGRKFVVFELGPLGCTPFLRFFTFNTSHGACFEPANQIVLTFNTGMRQLAHNLTKSLPGATVVFAKSYNFSLGIIQGTGKNYGYTDAKDSCCGAGPFNTAVNCGRAVPKNLPYRPFLCSDPAKYFFWDGSHPTDKTNRLLFDRIWRGDKTAVEPMNLRALAKLAIDS